MTNENELKCENKINMPGPSLNMWGNTSISAAKFKRQNLIDKKFAEKSYQLNFPASQKFCGRTIWRGGGRQPFYVTSDHMLKYASY